MMNKKFDDVLINKDFIALYAYPDVKASCPVADKSRGCENFFNGPLPMDNTELHFDLEMDGQPNDKDIIVPALNVRGSKLVRKLSKEAYKNADDGKRAIYNEDIHADFKSIALNSKYLTNLMTGFMDPDEEAHLTAQIESKHLNLDEANLGSLDLDDDPSMDIGPDEYTYEDFHEDVHDYPHEVDYIINKDMDPIYDNEDMVNNQSGVQMLVGYEVRPSVNGMTIVAENNSDNIKKMTRVIKAHAPEYLKSFHNVISHAKVAEE